MIANILISAAPSLLAAMGALVSEYAGVMAVFLEGVINLGAFFCFALTAVTGSAAAGAAGSLCVCTLIIFLVSVFTEKTKANPFLTGLAVNLFSSGITSVLSSLWFKTRGVVSSEILMAAGSRFLPPQAFPSADSFFPQGGTALFAWATAAASAVLIYASPWGLRLRIAGKNPDVLYARGISASKYRILSWCIAAAFGAAAGCILTVRLQAFVPNVSSGRGWTALAAVFLGRRNPAGVTAAVVLFAAAEYWANTLQSTAGIPPSLLLALPYVVALICFLFYRKRN